jgi:hypothetical protein
MESILEPMVRSDEPILEAAPPAAPPVAERLAPPATLGGFVLYQGKRVAPAMLPYLQALSDRARRMGASFRVGSGYRSPAEQAALRVRWQSGDPSVAFPPAKHSYHELGLAVDLDGLDRAQLEELGRYWESLGGRWGGRFGDWNHFDLGRS